MIKLKLDKKSPVPFYRQILDMVLLGISSRTILPGEKLPTVREASVNLEVNPNTVAKAYTHLRLLGVLDTQQGSGVFVKAAPADSRTPDEKRQAIDLLCCDFIGRAQLLNISLDDLFEHMRQLQLGEKENGKDRDRSEGRIGNHNVSTEPGA